MAESTRKGKLGQGKDDLANCEWTAMTKVCLESREFCYCLKNTRAAVTKDCPGKDIEECRCSNDESVPE